MRTYHTKLHCGAWCLAYLTILSIGVLPCTGQQDRFDAVLREVVINAGKARYGFVLIGPDLGRYPPGPRFSPAEGLDTKEAVPFLLRVLIEGPDWTDEQMLTEQGGIYPHIARCYAALCLGAIGDANALEPLIEMLRHGDYLEHKYTITSGEKQRHDIRAYAAIALGLLGDERAFDPMLEQLAKSPNVHVAFALARLGDVRAITPLIRYGFQLDPEAHVHIHRCLEELSKTRATIQYDRNDKTVTDPVFPELGRMERLVAYRRHWEHWLTNGRRYAKEQFDLYYDEWRRSLKEWPQARDVHASLMRKMLVGGVAIIPELMDKLEVDGEDLLPAIELLVGPLISKWPDKPMTRPQVLNWWKANRHKWIEQKLVDR